MDQQKEIPESVGKHKTDTLNKYINLIHKKLLANETFEAEYLFKYLNEENRDKAVKILNEKGYECTKWTILLINKKI